MNRTNTEKLRECFEDIRNVLGLEEEYMYYMFNRIHKSTIGKEIIMGHTYDYLTQIKNMSSLDAMQSIFKNYGNVNLFVKMNRDPKYKEIFDSIFIDNNVVPENIADKYRESLSRYVVLVHFLKGLLHPCVECGKYTLNQYCSIRCCKLAQMKNNIKNGIKSKLETITEEEYLIN